jgi:hypothetical protein
MSDPILRHQSDVGNQSPMPTDRVDETSVVNTSPPETVVWLYSNSGVWAAAAGEAAGTIVTYKTTYDGILNSVNAVIGHSQDTSLSFAAATRASQIVNVSEDIFYKIQQLSVADQVTEMTKRLPTAGDYAIDHRRGQIWCNSKATVANDSITYDYKTVISGGSGTTSDKIQGNVAHDAADAGNPVKIGGVARTAQATAVANGDRVDATYNVYGEQVIAGYTWATNSIRVEEIDPISQHYVTETLAALTNIATNTTAYLYTAWNGYRYGSYQGITSGTAPTDTLTCTLEATVQDDGTAPASCSYDDITTTATGSASFVDTNFKWYLDTPFADVYQRLKYVTSNDAGNDADLTVHHKRMY